MLSVSVVLGFGNILNIASWSIPCNNSGKEQTQEESFSTDAMKSFSENDLDWLVKLPETVWDARQQSPTWDFCSKDRFANKLIP